MKLSILIAAYNVDKFINKCVISCYDRTVQDDYEIIVVNDGSSDTTMRLVTDLLPQIPNLRLINKKNEGLGAARNSGLTEAKGQYIWFIDGDDFIGENVLPKIINKLYQDNLDALALNYNITDAQYNITLKAASSVKLTNGIVTGSEFYKDNYAKSYSCMMILKSSLFSDYDIYFKERINMQDSEIMPKLLINVDRLAYLNDAVYNYVQHPQSFTNSNNGLKRFAYFESIIIVRDSLDKFRQNLKNKDIEMGLLQKEIGLHHTVLNHLVFFKYSSADFRKILNLLSKNHFYPLKFKPTGKMIFVKWGLNHFPILTQKVINVIRNDK